MRPSFPVLRLSRVDVKRATGFPMARALTNAQMETLAEKVGDALVMVYWNTIEDICKDEPFRSWLEGIKDGDCN